MLTFVLIISPQFTVNTLAQETIERMPETYNNEAPTLTPYLTSNFNNDMTSKENKTFANVE